MHNMPDSQSESLIVERIFYIVDLASLISNDNMETLIHQCGKFSQAGSLKLKWLHT